MKKYAIFLTIILASALSIVSALAAAGDAADPLISLSYLTGTYRDSIHFAVQDALDTATETIRQDTADKMNAAGLYLDRQWADTWMEARLKQDDTLYGSTGLSLLVLAGDVTVTFESGEIVDVSSGESVASGATLFTNHRYLVAEDTTAYFTVASKTAVVNYMGQYGTILSDAVDYNAMASILKKINLFRGSYTGYGSGFDLEVAPTRLQALIMFIRVLGEEEAALANTELPPFSDISPNTNAARYVGYAYKMGYTNGYKDGTWRPGGATNMYQYSEFLLRALGYSVVGNSISDAPQRAQAVGLMTSEDISSMIKEQFLRAHLVYLSYNALDVPTAGSGILLREQLISKGIFTEDDYNAAVSVFNSNSPS
ncbi:MAG: S-layer homology domain-containing protein [Ruminococcaceae bacterium]|nr:S-layer homology domain-containing protein [Oscillospiraceae bacterium]